MEWIQAAPGSPYFVTESGADWTPVGHNDAITWPTLRGCFARRDLPAVERYLEMLAAHGVTVLRLMMEYNQHEHRYFEKPAGRFVPAMVRLWDDLLPLCERHGIRVLLTPFDTFFLWIRWKRHPYNEANGGPVTSVKRMLLEPAAREAIKRRLEFMVARWGNSGVIFAWELWNEVHPSMAEDSDAVIPEFLEDLSTFVRETEQRLYGRAHLQAASIFGPIGEKYPLAMSTVLGHPCLDFATTHFYEEGTIDYPRNTVDAAVSTGAIMRTMLAQAPAGRPFLDSESGPIHSFKDKRISLPEAFDDEYFRHMQWAHFASGGAGGGMRWPNRRPHILTAGMHRAQQGLSAFLPLIAWSRFRRTNWNHEVEVRASEPVAAFASGDAEQAIVWLLRRERAARVDLTLPEMAAGRYQLTLWDTKAGRAIGRRELVHEGRPHMAALTVETDIALALARVTAR